MVLVFLRICLIFCFYIGNTCDAAQDSNSFVYRIDTDLGIDQFIHAENGQRVKSKVMKLDNFDFQLFFYPNGRLKEQENQFIIHLCVLNLSEKLKVSSIIADWNLFIHEINYAARVKDRHYSDNAQCRGFVIQNGAQVLHRLHEKYTSVTFSTTINIKHILSSKHIIEKNVPIKIKKHNNFVWNIDDKDILDEMKTAQHQQTYISEIYDHLWFMTLTPNGYHEGIYHSIDMFLHIIFLPKEVTKLFLKCKFEIIELNLQHQFEAEWTNGDRGWGVPSTKFPLNTLKETDLDKLTIETQCETLKVFDANQEEMKMHPNWKYFQIKRKNHRIKKKENMWSNKIAKLLDDDSNCDKYDDGYCMANNQTNDSNEDIHTMLRIMSNDLDMIRQQLFVSIGMFTVYFGVSIVMFSIMFGLLCCGSNCFC